MSQLIVCRNSHGIILSSDSNADDVDVGGNLTSRQIKRLFQLSSHAAILTGGAAAGEQMCHSLKDFVAQEGLRDVEDVYTAAMPFLASEFEHHMRKTCEFMPVDPIHQVYFILAGYSSKDAASPFHLYFLWTKKKLPQLDGDEITSAFTAPRIIRLEYKLHQLCKDETPLEQILPEIRTALGKQAEVQEEVAAPFSYAFITKDGFRRIDE